ncbi:Nucleotidylyl transferase [Dissoconium aciculare CBS 342.82]|uniref:Nucleotidylyl transferase n=1 Tax=Dissoconium aciculare CBS 342.82 TaxID=1314786 RepID=A0A6J3LWY0_9PEZI|nr:Nucleotidylyl transferase [Dissoconium aciculare CBS 342.82]KAF1820261.1 Nucleotidylyl transferase [Dissoconium aciculare CBS 342.82]
MSTEQTDRMNRFQSYRRLVTEFESVLSTFESSDRKFQIVKTIYPRLDRSSSLPHAVIEDHAPLEPNSADSPKTLIILDSSFNPPSNAHQNLALRSLSKSYISRFTGPHRLLLLFAVLNADKGGSSPAAFPQRLTMMSLFAQDLLQTMLNDRASSEAEQNFEEYSPVPIDIGITKVPYYTDKSIAIASTRSQLDGNLIYPDFPKHMHLLGFDTLIRFFNPKYYPSFDPPLSALKDFFEPGHRLRATMRPDDASDQVAEQRSWLNRLEQGQMEVDGGKREWSNQIELVEPNQQQGVSSTKIRKAAAEGNWQTVKGLCPEVIASWIRDQELYKD